MIKNKPAFTLLEMVVGLSIFIAVLFLLLPLTGENFQRQLLRQETSGLEWHLFLIQLEQETKESKYLGVVNNQILFEEEDPKIKSQTKIELYQSMVRKVKNSGHHPLLLNVAAFKVVEKEGKVMIEVEFLDGRKKKANSYLGER